MSLCYVAVYFFFVKVYDNARSVTISPEKAIIKFNASYIVMRINSFPS